MLFYVADATCDAEGVGAECIERWPLYVFLTSATVCLGTSAVYHLFGTANEKWERELRNVDYAGIVSLIVGSCAPVVQYGFGDAYPVTRIGYMLAIAGLGAAVLVCSFTSWFDRHLRHGHKVPPRQCPSLASCGSVGRSWGLWLARHSQGKRSGHWAPSHRQGARASRLQSRPFFF